VIAFALVIGTCVGIVIGAGLVRPYLDSPPKQRKPKPPTIPLARAIHAVTWRHLELPPMQRNQRIPTVKP
jgi:hypothetical protein